MNTREPQTHPDALDALTAAVRAALRCVAIAAVVCLALAQCGCGGATGITGVAGALKTTLDVIRVTRGIICTTALDAIAGNPREGQPEWVIKDAGAPTDAAGD